MPAAKKTEETQPPQVVEKPDNLRIWNKVRTTDKAATRPFSVGKFSGTEINSNYSQKKATDIFGPVGLGWGYSVIAEGFEDGAPCFNDQKESVGYDRLHWLRIQLWYVDPLTGERGELEHYGNTPYVQWVRSGQYFSTDSEAPKKSLTDAIGKALSLLGFGADIYSGKWDDSKYNGAQSEVSVSQSSSKPAAVQAAKSAPADIGKFDWAKLKNVTGFSSEGIAELAKARKYPASPSKLSDAQKATLRFDLLLTWAKGQGQPISEIPKSLHTDHVNMRDDQLIAAIKQVGTQAAG